MKDQKERLEIEINPFKVLWIAKKSILTSSGSEASYVILIVFGIVWYLLNKFAFATISSFSPSILLAPSITALAFTLALLTATMRIFSIEHLADFYVFKGNKNEYAHGELFYNTIALYIWTSLLWFIISIAALASFLFRFNFNYRIKLTLSILVGTLVLFGLASLWNLITEFIKDISMDTERELKKRDDVPLIAKSATKRSKPK